MSKEMDRNSTFAKVLENCGIFFSSSCRDLISGIQDLNDQSYSEYLSNFKFIDARFQNSLFACGNIGAARPLESFQFLLDSFPDIDINSKSEPSSRIPGGGSNFLYLLGGIKWEDKHVRGCVKYTIHYIIAKVCHYVTMQSAQSMKKNDAIELINKIYEFIHSKSDPFNDFINKLIINEFKMAISYSSISARMETYNIVKLIFSDLKSNENLRPLIIFLFSETVFRFEDESQVKDLLKLVLPFYNEKDNSCEPAAACILNLLGQMFVSFPNSCSSDEIVDYYNKASGLPDQTSFELRSLILSFTSNKSIRMSIKDFAHKCFSENSHKETDLSTHIVKALTQFMYGANYIPKSIRLLQNEHYSWHVSANDYKDFLDMLEIVKKNIHFVAKASTDVLSDFLLQIACNDVSNFAEDVIKKITKDEKVFNTIEEAVLLTFLRILCINTNFITKAKIEKGESEKVLLKIKEEGYKMCKKLLKNKKGNELDSSMSIYVPPSFTQSLMTICSPMKHSISDIHTILSLPIMISVADQEYPKPRLLGVYMNKWKKSNPVFDEKPKSTLDEDKDHKRTRIALKAHVGVTDLPDLLKSMDDNRVTIAALNLAPLILTPSDNNSLIEWICSNIVSKEEAVGAMSVRSLQAAIHLNNENATKVINQLYLLETESVNTLNPDSIFLIVSALKSILETVAFERIPLDKSDYEHIFFIIFIGLISSCFITRAIALDATKLIQNPFVSQFYNKLDNVVSEVGKEFVFSALCPGTENIDDLDTIKFSNFARSKSTYLYTFYVAALADSLDNDRFSEIGDINNSSSDSLLPTDALVDYKDVIDVSKEVCKELRSFLIQLLSHSKNFEQDDPIFVIYVSSFLFAMWKDEDKQKHGINHYIKKLSELNIAGNEEWISAATQSISPNLFSTHLVDHLPPRPFALYLLRCTKKPTFIPDFCLHNQDAFKLGYSKFINDVFKSKCVSKEATFSIDMSSTVHNTYQTALYAFGKALTVIFAEFVKKQTRNLLNCNGIFPRNPISLPFVDDVLTSNESYAFWFNLSSQSNLYFSIPCQTAYAELVKIMYIPDIWFELVTANIEKIVEHTPDIAITLFTNYSGVLMPIYIRNSQTSYPFFAGIAKQLCTSTEFISEWRTKIANVAIDFCVSEEKGQCKMSIKPITADDDVNNPDSPERAIVLKSLNAAKRLSDLILRNIGTLQAIATGYLIGKDVFQRMTAFDFIYVTALSTHLIYANNVQGTLNLSDELLSVRETFMTNFEHFFANTASKVIYSLANHLPFLSEQFCSGIFAMESIKGGKRSEEEDENASDSNDNDLSKDGHHISLKKSKSIQRPNIASISSTTKNRGKTAIPLPPSPSQLRLANIPLNQSGIRQVSLTGISVFTQTNTNYLTSSTYINTNGLKKMGSQKQLSAYSSANMNQSGSMLVIPGAQFNPNNQEELVMSTFDKKSNEMCRYIASFIVPWMKRIRFVPERLHIFEGCLPSYQMFSMYTFIQSIVKLKCLLPITPPITDILYPTYKASGSLFLIILTDIYFKMENLRENCVAMITYAYTINSKHVMQHFLSFLNVRYWYYQQIQISKLNQAFDFRLFLQDMNVSGESNEHDQQVNIDYTGMVSFVLKMFVIFLKENPAQILPYKNLIIAYCALFFRDFVDTAQELFHLLLNLKPLGSCKIERSINYIGPYTYEPLMDIFKQSILSHVISLIKPSLYSSSPSSLSTAVASGIFDLAASFDLNDEENSAFHKTYSFENETNINEPQFDINMQMNVRNLLSVKNKTAVVNSFSMKDASRYLIEWGLICGDSFVSSMALKMFITLDFKATESEINYALDSIYLIYIMVKDAATARSTSGRQTLLKLADSDVKPDCATAYTHIQYLCMLCQNVIPNPSTELVNRILLTSFALLLLPEPGKIIKDQTRAKPEPIVSAALRNIYTYRDSLPGFNPEKLIESKFDSSRTTNKEGKDLESVQSSSSMRSISTDMLSFQGFTYYLFNTALNDESLELGQKILIFLLQKKLSFLLNGSGNDPAFTYYAIAPFLFASKSTQNTEDEITNKEIKKAFVEMGTKQSKESLENLHKALVKNNISKINKKDSLSSSFERLFNFYRTIVRIGNVQQVKAVLILSTLIIHDHLFINSAQVIGELSRDIIQKRDYELKEDVNHFYKALINEFGGKISTQKKPATATTKEFPYLFGGIKEEDVLEWRPSDLVTSVGTPINTNINGEDNDAESNADGETLVDTSSTLQSAKEIDVDNDDSDGSYDDDNNLKNEDSNMIDDNVDVFKKPKFYPPLFLTDYSLFVSDFMNNLLPVVEQVKVQPFTKWDDEIFSEEQVAQKNADKDNPYENSIAVCYDDELEGDEKLALTKNEKKIKKVAKELQKLIDGRNQSKSKDNRLTSTINPVHSAVQYCFVDPSLFCPNLSMVDKITSAGDSKEAELPSIFFPA